MVRWGKKTSLRSLGRKLVGHKLSHDDIVHLDSGVEVAKVQVEHEELFDVGACRVFTEQLEVVHHVFLELASIIRHHRRRLLAQVQLQLCLQRVLVSITVARLG